MYFKSLCKNGFKWSWKDYSFSTGSKEISFDVYQRTSDQPVLRILKNLNQIIIMKNILLKDKNGKVLKKSESLKSNR